MKLDSDDVQREACWVISNISSGGRSEHLRYLMEQNAVAGLCNLLVARDNRTVKVALEGIENLLRHGLREVKLMPDVPAPGQRKNACVLAVEACGGLDKIEALQHAADHSTYELAHRLLEEYFDAKPEEEGEGDRVG